MTDKLLTALVGISSNMEKSLDKIEKTLSASSSSAGKASSALGGLAQTLNSLLTAVSSKKFNTKQAKNIIDFSKNLVQISSTIDVKKSNSFQGFVSAMVSSLTSIIDIMSPSNMIKLQIGSKILFEGKNPLLAKIVGGINSAFKNVDVKKLLDGSKAIQALGDGLMSLTKAMKSLVLIGVLAPLIAVGSLVVYGVVYLFHFLGKHADDIKNGGKAIGEMGKGLKTASMGLSLLALFTVVAGPMALEGIGIIAMFALTFYTLGKAEKPIREGARALSFIGLAIFGFTASLASYMLLLFIVKPEKIVEGIIVLAGFGLIFALLGNNAVKNAIVDGALSLLAISLGLLIFSAGLLIYGMAIDKLSWSGIAQGLILLGALSFITMELGAELEVIATGALAMVTMGLALAAFSIGLLTFGLALKALDPKDIVKGGEILVTLGGAFALVGLMNGSGAIPLGAAGVFEMGGALAAVSFGIIAYSLAIKALIALFEGNPLTASVVAASVLVGLSGAFFAAGFGPMPVAIMAGATAMIEVGLALLSVSGGILVYGLAIKALQALFPDLTKAGEIAGSILFGIAGSFAAIGIISPLVILGSFAILATSAALATTSVGIFLFGHALSFLDNKNLLEKNSHGHYTIKGLSILTSIASNFSEIGWNALSIPFWTGIAASVAMSAALLSISLSLFAIGSVLKNAPDTKEITDKLFGAGGFVPAIAEGFKSIGKNYGAGFLSKFLGTDEVSLGVQTVKGFGDVLKDIAGGIAAFANFDDFPIKTVKGDKLVDSTTNIFKVVSEIGVQVPILLTTLASVFSVIGAQYGGSFFSSSSVQKGVDAVKGIGSVLSELAGGIAAFSNFETFPIKSVSGGKLIDTTVNLFDIVPKIKSVLIGDGTLSGKVSGKSGLLFALADIFGEIGDKYSGGFFQKSNVQKGIDAVKGIGGVLNDLAQGIIAFAKMSNGSGGYHYPVLDKKGNVISYTDFKLEDVEKNISSILLTLPSAFDNVDLTKMKSAGEKAKAVVPLADSISQISKDLQDLSSKKNKTIDAKIIQKDLSDIASLIQNMITTFSFKDDKALMTAKKNADMVASLSEAVANVGKSLESISKTKSNKTAIDASVNSVTAFVNNLKDLKISDATISQMNSLSSILQKFSDYGDGLQSFAKGLTETGKAFGTFSGGFDKFSSKLDKFTTFESAFSNLMKNQSNYRFDSFASSMGTLKNNVNNFNVENLKFTDSLMKSLAVLSKSPDAVGSVINKSIEDAVKELVVAIKGISPDKTTADNSSLFGAAPSPITVGKVPTPDVTENKSNVQQSIKQQQENSAVLLAITQLQASVDLLASKFRMGPKGGIMVEEK